MPNIFARANSVSIEYILGISYLCCIYSSDLPTESRMLLVALTWKHTTFEHHQNEIRFVVGRKIWKSMDHGKAQISECTVRTSLFIFSIWELIFPSSAAFSPHHIALYRPNALGDNGCAMVLN